MSTLLPSLRLDLDILPSPDTSRPGLVLRDPYQYSSATLLIPPALINGLRLFNGERSRRDLQIEFAVLAGVIQGKAIADGLSHALDGAGFLNNATYHAMKARREQEFAMAPVRDAALAGSAYPKDKDHLKKLFALRIGEEDGANTSKTLGIAAPHASPDGAWATYRAAYRSFPSETMDGRTFVILGTSHYGTPERFGLTRKPFITPLGETQVDLRLVDELERTAPKAVCMEDYCHSIEHSIELQVIFLQYLYGPDIRILPILCGPFSKSMLKDGLPEDNEDMQRFFDALANLAAREGRRLFWVLGVDMAHIGARYGDPDPARADCDGMLDVKQRDHRRIDQLIAGDSRLYWNLIQEKNDDLKWCGSAPFYTFLKAMPHARGSLLHYHQWQIDQASVVSFAALRFD